MPMRLLTVTDSRFGENCSILWQEGKSECVVVDPGVEPQKVLDALAERGLSATAILNTHGHYDHVAGNAALKGAFPDAPLLIGRGDAPMLTDPSLNLSAFLGTPIVSPPAERLLDEGDVIAFADIEMRVLELPGHSPGHVVFLLNDSEPPVVVAGDTLFRGGIGRTDFPGGSRQQLLAGIRGKLFTLPDDTQIYPGHGDATTVGRERAGNPFLAE